LSIKKSLRRKPLIAALSVAVCAAIAVTATVTATLCAPTASSGVQWNGAPDKAVAANIDAVQNTTRIGASGDKIPSNAHSADFPGIYFIWDSKQKDNGYLKVDASMFDTAESFVLTAKESSTYWDFTIAPQPG